LVERIAAAREAVAKMRTEVAEAKPVPTQPVEAVEPAVAVPEQEAVVEPESVQQPSVYAAMAGGVLQDPRKCFFNLSGNCRLYLQQLYATGCESIII